jgi:hypothetical protein
MNSNIRGGLFAEFVLKPLHDGEDPDVRQFLFHHGLSAFAFNFKHLPVSKLVELSKDREGCLRLDGVGPAGYVKLRNFLDKIFHYVEFYDQLVDVEPSPRRYLDLHDPDLSGMTTAAATQLLRRIEIYKRYHELKSLRKTATEYKISVERVRQIVAKIKRQIGVVSPVSN